MSFIRHEPVVVSDGVDNRVASWLSTEISGDESMPSHAPLDIVLDIDAGGACTVASITDTVAQATLALPLRARVSVGADGGGLVTAFEDPATDEVLWEPAP